MKDERLTEMRIFKAVAESGGFTAAALALDMQQPYVSRVVSNLEKRLGVSLLRRSTRRRHFGKLISTFDSLPFAFQDSLKQVHPCI